MCNAYFLTIERKTLIGIIPKINPVHSLTPGGIAANAECLVCNI